jgi:hypothetical protein
MMREAFWLVVALGAGGCGTSTPDDREPAAAAAKEPRADGSPPAAAVAAASPPASDGNVLRGRAVVAADAGVEAEGEVSLTIAADGTITGAISVGGVAHVLSGLVEDERVRCWVHGGGSDPGNVRRGFLVGDARDGAGGYAGTFAVSGHAGAGPLRGTWKAGGPSD